MEGPNRNHDGRNPQQLEQRIQQRLQELEQNQRALDKVQERRDQLDHELEQIQAQKRQHQRVLAMLKLVDNYLRGQNGLTRERIERFQHFEAGESLDGEKCIVCREDLEFGTQMVRLDCHVSHYLCKICTVEWFKDNNRCPTCNNIFK